MWKIPLFATVFLLTTKMSDITEPGCSSNSYFSTTSPDCSAGPALRRSLKYSPGSPSAHLSACSTTVICSCNFTPSHAGGFFSSTLLIPTPRLKGNDSLPAQKATTQESMINKWVMKETSQIVCSRGRDGIFHSQLAFFAFKGRYILEIPYHCYNLMNTSKVNPCLLIGSRH